MKSYLGLFKQLRLRLRQSIPSLPIIFSEPDGSGRTPYGFKIVCKICCGIDVHKTFAAACIASTNDKDVTTYEYHQNPTDTSFDPEPLVYKSLKKKLPELCDAIDGFTIGANTGAFPSAKHLCSWAGLTPTNNESAGKKKTVRISVLKSVAATKRQSLP